MSWRDKPIGVLLGGDSPEAEISRKTGDAVVQALSEAGHRAIPIEAAMGFPREIRANKIATVFNALHGGKGENGVVQGLLEWLKVPYTGSGPLASAIGMDKWMTKRLMSTLKVPMPAAINLPSFEPDEAVKTMLDRPIDFPSILKRVDGGSTLGLYRIADAGGLAEALTEIAAQPGAHPGQWFFEEQINGAEVTAAIVGNAPLPLVEVRPRGGVYDYTHKYTSGLTDYICPAEVDKTTERTVQKYALSIHRTLGCRGATRSDFMLNTLGEPKFLEINTLPGLTATSLVPKAAAEAGMSFAQLLEKILDEAGLESATG